MVATGRKRRRINHIGDIYYINMGCLVDRLDRAMRVLRNLPALAVATQRRTGQAAGDDIRNRAIKSIDVIRKCRGNKRRVDRCMREAWTIYRRLQNLTGADFFVDNNNDDPKRTVTLAPEMYSGGLGFRHVNWDAEFLMAMPKRHEQYNPFWNPSSGKRDKYGRLLNLEDSDYWVFKDERKTFK